MNERSAAIATHTVRFRLLAVGAAVATLLTVNTQPATAAGVLRADYRFESDFRSSVSGVNRLTPFGPGVEIVRRSVRGVRQGVAKWPDGSGLELTDAREAVRSPDDYTIVMLVLLHDVDDWMKLISFDRDDEWGLYVDTGYLRIYDLEASNTEVFDANRWYQVAMTRNANGRCKVYIDGRLVVDVADPDGKQVLDAAQILRFVADDGGGSEASSGLLARLRIFDGPLSAKQVRQLGI